MRKLKTIEKLLQFNCPTCQKIYQLSENHFQPKKFESSPNFSSCSNDCQAKWKDILHDYHQDQTFANLAKKEQEKDGEESNDNYDN